MNQVLRLDQSGLPHRWITKQDAALLYVQNKVLWELGNQKLLIRGGIDRLGRVSQLELAPVVAVSGKARRRHGTKPALVNRVLFRRDNNLCMYCGESFSVGELTRDHVIPKVQGGRDVWTNVVTACQRCNHFKGGRTPEQAGMELLAVPFQPNPYEFMFLANRRILADQMEYLSARFSGQRTWQALM